MDSRIYLPYDKWYEWFRRVRLRHFKLRKIANERRKTVQITWINRFLVASTCLHWKQFTQVPIHQIERRLGLVAYSGIHPDMQKFAGPSPVNAIWLRSICCRCRNERLTVCICVHFIVLIGFHNDQLSLNKNGFNNCQVYQTIVHFNTLCKEWVPNISLNKLRCTLN